MNENIPDRLRIIKARHPSYIEIVEAELDHYKKLSAELIVQVNELKAQLHKEQLSFHFK